MGVRDFHPMQAWEGGGGRWLLDACPCWVQPTMGVAGISSGNHRGGAEQVCTGVWSGRISEDLLRPELEG